MKTSVSTQVLAQAELVDRVRGINDEFQNDGTLPRRAAWEVVDGKLHKTFVFKHFIEAFAFMTHGALIAEKMNHHPEWSNVYKTVVVDLITHHSNGITQLDIDLARNMEKFNAP